MNSNIDNLNSIISEARRELKRENPQLHDTSVNRKDLVAQADRQCDTRGRHKVHEGRWSRCGVADGLYCLVVKVIKMEQP